MLSEISQVLNHFKGNMKKDWHLVPTKSFFVKYSFGCIIIQFHLIGLQMQLIKGYYKLYDFFLKWN